MVQRRGRAGLAGGAAHDPRRTPCVAFPRAPRAKPLTTPPWYSPLAILTALTLRSVFRLAYRQAEGLLASVVGLLGLTPRVPDHTTLSRRAAMLEVPRPGRTSTGAGGGSGNGAAPMHLLVDSTGLKLCGAGGAGEGSARGVSGVPA